MMSNAFHNKHIDQSLQSPFEELGEWEEVKRLTKEQIENHKKTGILPPDAAEDYDDESHNDKPAR